MEPDMSFLYLGTIPVDYNLPSPAELLLCRPIQDTLARKISRDPASEEITSRLTERRQLQKYYYHRSNPALISGQEPAKLNWKLAAIKERLNGVPLSCVVTTSTGRELRCKRVHIWRPTKMRYLDQTQMIEQSSPYDTPSVSPSTTDPLPPPSQP